MQKRTSRADSEKKAIENKAPSKLLVHESAGAVVGGVAGGLLGLVAGPPGAIVGAVAGAAAGATMEEDIERVVHRRRDAKKRSRA